MGRRPAQQRKFDIAGTLINEEQIPRLLSAARELREQQAEPGLGIEYIDRLIQKLEEAQRESEQTLATV
jgi:hypothetical protein